MSFSAKNLHSEHFITYDEALVRIARLASTPIVNDDKYAQDSHEALFREGQARLDSDSESATLLEAVGYKSTRTLHAPHSTPRTDTSAMDGFAVNARNTMNASEDLPLELRVVDSISAGDDRSGISIDIDPADLHNICVEIMTGACFPEQELPHLDSVVKVEDVILSERCSKDGSLISRYIQLNKSVKTFQHRRPAGSDFTEGEIIVERGETLEPRHVAALASLGYARVEIMARSYAGRPHKASTDKLIPLLRVGVLSTGSEIVDDLDKLRQFGKQGMTSKQAIPDSNGPYVVSSLRSAFPCIAVEHLGIVRDDEEELTLCLKKAVFEDGFDVVITSGGVSKGRHDLVRYIIETRLQGRVVFHGVKIRPGAPVLCAAFDHLDGAISEAGRRQAVFFGAPGNPIATAATLRFFIIPYVARAISRDVEHATSHVKRALISPKTIQDQNKLGNLQPLYRKPKGLTAFRLARQRARDVDHVEFVEDQASYKLRGLLEADCWIIASDGSSEFFCGDQVVLSPL